MKISEIYALDKSQSELDFVDIDVEKDTPLFIEPSYIAQRQDEWSQGASRTIRNFFQNVLNEVREGNTDTAFRLFDHLGEVDSTCLGLSKGKPQGRGVGLINSQNIFRNILRSRAMESGLIQDIQDNVIFVEGFDKDYLSDMTTNIIRRHLIEYTKNQCTLHGITVRRNTSTGHFWDAYSQQWVNSYDDMLVIQDQIILLVPKAIVSFSKNYIAPKYYNYYVLDFLQSEHITMGGMLVQQRKDGTRFVTKKSLKERHPCSKSFLADFSIEHPDVFQKFKRETFTHVLSNEDISTEVYQQISQTLKEKLLAIPAGNNDATIYHKLIKGILEHLFYPHLICPVLEREIHEGRKRIDIVFQNGAETGIFFRLPSTMKIPCNHVMVECKNYSSDPINPELDQLSGRFSPQRGKVGLLLCRTINNMQLFLNRCKDTYGDDRGLIIPIVDCDVIYLLDSYDGTNIEVVERFMVERVYSIIG